MWFRYFLVPFLIVLFAETTPAGIFKKTTPKPDPVKHVPELIATLKGEKDENKRIEAAVELREYDTKTFPDVLPALLQALQNDPSSSVRTEAVNSLSKVRPITQQAGYALEQALANDSSIRVRLAARTTLWQYHLLGYRSGKPNESGDNQSKEPPLAAPKSTPPTTPQPKTNEPTVTTQSKLVVPPSTPRVQPPLLTVPSLPATKTNPLAKPETNPIPTFKQSVEPPLAQPTSTKLAPVVKPVDVPKIEPKLTLPILPPTVIETPMKIEKPPVVSTKPVDVQKQEVDGPILTPPKY